MEFVKFNESKTLRKKEEEESEKHKAMKDVISADGTEVASQRVLQSKIAIEKHTISCHHPSADSDCEEDNEPSKEAIETCFTTNQVQKSGMDNPTVPRL